MIGLLSALMIPRIRALLVVLLISTLVAALCKQITLNENPKATRIKAEIGIQLVFFRYTIR